ncbi:hypothetical protein C8Q80DRAFT_1302173 [Daedaleopsis nitida]|nr:hypothetical protein C8Q80DRAFT_1302173 [Daedaleopsis nitida]
MDSFTRAELLLALQALGVDVPAHTKIPDGALQTRLRDALEAAQYKDHFPPSLDLRTLPEWPVSTPANPTAKKGPLLDAFRRGNWDEVRQAVEGVLPDEGRNPFTELRIAFKTMAHFLDTGSKWWIVQDPADAKRTINIRVVTALQIDENTPALVALYRHFDRSTAAQSSSWVREQADKHPSSVAGPDGVLTIHATALEQKILGKILKLNAALLPAGYEVGRLPTEKSFHLSVIVPIGPLEYDALAKLNSNTGCAVCGKKATNRWCHSVSYCGTACQRADWPNHKDECQALSLKDAKWVEVKMSATPFSSMTDGMVFSNLNKSSNINLGFSDKTSASSTIDSSRVPPNEQGGLPGGRPPGHFMIYDRKRTFQSFLLREDDTDGFHDVLGEMVASPRRRCDGCKMYRWAKRTGDWELSICLDREPKLEACKW